MRTSSRRAYLDLGIDGTHLGRVVIKVMDESNYAHNFLHMCIGDLGPSYASSGVTWVLDEGEDGERLALGEYTMNGETSSRAVLSGVDWEREEERDIYEEKLVKAGQVLGDFSVDYASMFDIVTRDDLRWRDRDCFGMVEEGLDVLRLAILHYPDIESIKITDCGLIFSQ